MWNKTVRIKINTIIRPVHDGGIGIVDIEAKMNIKNLTTKLIFIIFLICYV